MRLFESVLKYVNTFGCDGICIRVGFGLSEKKAKKAKKAKYNKCATTFMVLWGFRGGFKGGVYSF